MFSHFGGMDGRFQDPNQKQKRARISFSHAQLSLMKARFEQNQNPDAKELDELSQQTNLEKKNLQVH